MKDKLSEFFTILYGYKDRDAANFISTFISLVKHDKELHNEDKILIIDSIFDTIDLDKVDTWVLIPMLRSAAVYKEHIESYQYIVEYTVQECYNSNLDPKKEMYGLWK